MVIDFNISKAHFIDQYQGKKPLLIKNAFDVSQAFSWADANQIIERSSVDSDDFKILHNGLVPKHEYVEAYYDVGMVRHRLIKSAVYERMKNGATLIANKIVNEPKVHAFARQVAQFTGRQTVSSAYAAFGRQASFQTHWDTRDIFSIQLLGRKRWIVYEPSFNDPLYMQQSKDLEQDYPCPAEAYMDFILAPGDVLYLPRGWWHNPLPFEEETFHLSIGTFPAHALDYLQWSVQQQLPTLAAARKAMRTFEHDRETLSQLVTQFAELITDPAHYERFMDAFDAAQRVETPLAIDLLGNASVKQLPDHVGLQLSANCTLSIAQNYLIANGTRITLDPQALLLVSTIEQSPGIRLGELLARRPDLDSAKLRDLMFELCHQDILELIRS
ncbi:JmjC domain-containing protein [Pseudomonas fontis]|uniref:Cupin-like domain-containing protein n=1 Tax=Pseudomonas fontis TaxID=2942633 RepID=A0ABT5NKU6_9PSED|nr:cupin domain-containing protein [Pseudomonas fontis]MDD0975996.1 cupin-like domain-containing protein [Pseudomonas fontis]MDD0989149.1 cupin-like domain-containing protein [Pseudomonas fontis]